MRNRLKNLQTKMDKNWSKKNDFSGKSKKQDSTGKQQKKIKIPKNKELSLRFYSSGGRQQNTLFEFCWCFANKNNLLG